MSNEEKVTVSVRMTKVMHEKLKELHWNLRMHMSDIVCECVDFHLKKFEKEKSPAGPQGGESVPAGIATASSTAVPG